MKPKFQFTLAKLCAAMALTAIPFALDHELPDRPVFNFVVVAGFLWGCAAGLLVARSRAGVAWFGLAGVAVFFAWTGLARAIDRW
jgi:hypothetical protein